MNEQNPNNIIVIDRISKKVLNEPQIEIDEEVYAEVVCNGREGDRNCRPLKRTRLKNVNW